MIMEIHIKINDKIMIPTSVFVFKTSRSSKPGGQNVNKTNSRVTLEFDITNSDHFSSHQKERLLLRLKTRISSDCILRITSQKFRSQLANKKATMERFAEIISDALDELPYRMKTKIPKVEREKRREEKKRRSVLKLLRSKNILKDDSDNGI